MYLLDNSGARLNHSDDERVIFQDRYWPSVIAYGRFLNGEQSIHTHQNFKPFFLAPRVVVHLSCSYEEKIGRSKKRLSNSPFDSSLLENPHKIIQLEREICGSLEGIEDIYNLDTTGMTIPEVARNVLDYLSRRNVIPEEVLLK